MENQLKKLIQIIEDMGPNPWEQIPDIDLYIDQVLDYMKRQHPGLNLNETLTSSMVNNYAKQGLIPRAKGKKYNREHISKLTIICLLKQIISVGDTKFFLDNFQNPKALYENYTALFSGQASDLSDVFSSLSLKDETDETDIHQLILKMAITSYLYKFACEYLIDALEKADKNKEEIGEETGDNTNEKK